MKPHPSFADQNIPTKYQLGNLVLKTLTIDDLDRDYEAVMHSAAEIKAANPTLGWPADDMTREENLVDLGWHQKEFQSRRSFAWVIEDNTGNYAGCAYVYPSIAGEKAADVAWWWKTGVNVDRQQFKTLFLAWLAGPDWPTLDYYTVDMR